MDDDQNINMRVLLVIFLLSITLILVSFIIFQGKPLVIDKNAIKGLGLVNPADMNGKQNLSEAELILLRANNKIKQEEGKIK